MAISKTKEEVFALLLETKNEIYKTYKTLEAQETKLKNIAATMAIERMAFGDLIDLIEELEEENFKDEFQQTLKPKEES